MWIVRVALQRPYTFIMLAVLIVLHGRLRDPENRDGYFSEHQDSDRRGHLALQRHSARGNRQSHRAVLRARAQTVVNDVEHTESQSVIGTSVVKYFFQPDVDQDLSMSQITAVSQIANRVLAARERPRPSYLSYNASSVPILQLALSSETLPERRSTISPTP